MVQSENPVIKRIVNHELLLQHFGYWPDFHDAEITEVNFKAHSGYRATVTFVIASFGMTSELDERGYYKLEKQCYIELQFTGIQEMEFDYFGHQNVLFDLVFEEIGSTIQCTFNSSVGLDAVIIAEEACVLSLAAAK